MESAWDIRRMRAEPRAQAKTSATSSWLSIWIAWRARAAFAWPCKCRYRRMNKQAALLKTGGIHNWLHHFWLITFCHCVGWVARENKQGQPIEDGAIWECRQDNFSQSKVVHQMRPELEEASSFVSKRLSGAFLVSDLYEVKVVFYTCWKTNGFNIGR